MQKILEGDLSRFEVPDLLTFLNMGRRTGVLVMERSDQESKLFFREGKPIFANSSREDLRFGAVLVRHGRLTNEELERVLRRQRTEGGKIGEALMAENFVKAEELPSFLKVHVSEVIFDTFVWKEGTFVFYDKVPPPATAVTLEMDLQNLIMEGVRRIDERARLSEVFPDLDMVAESVANTEHVKHAVNLTKEEWQIFFLVDGRRTLKDICLAAGNPDELATLEILHRLVTAKFLVILPAVPAEPGAIPGLAGWVPPPGAEPEGTQRWVEARHGPVPGAGFSVEFSHPAPPAKKEDDTKEVVTPAAVKYLEDSRRITLSRLILVKDGSEASFPLAKDACTLGRHRNNDIVITDPKVSSFHARIDRTADGFVLVDLKSRNGSYVNGNRIDRHLLATDDEVRLGTARLRYKVDYTAEGA